MSDHLLALRPYQRDCIDAIHASEAERPAVVLPTGAGKTIVFSHLISEHLAKHGTRAAVLVHRDELADQAMAKIRSVAPHLKVGKVKAGDNDVDADVAVCSVQTLARSNRLAALVRSQFGGREFGLVVHDECHHSLAESYQRVIEGLGGARHVGFTATLARGDGEGLGGVWDDVAYSRSVLQMIADGYLVDVEGIAVDIQGLELGAVKKSGGDYQAAALGDAMMEADGPRVIAACMLKHAADRRSIVFCPTVAMAHATAKELGHQGVPCGTVDGTTPREDRLKVYSAFAAGTLRAIVNVGVLTEGFDMPQADCVVVARPTRSRPLMIQMVGRVLRTYPGKGKALALCFGGGDGMVSTLIDLAPGTAIRSVRPGEGLLEAAVRSEEGANAPVRAGSVRFAIKHREMDLFAASSLTWLRTPQGVLFLPTMKGEVFLWPSRETGAWDVCFAPDGGLKWQRLREGLDLSGALETAQREAESRPGVDAKRTAGWRRGPATKEQVSRFRSRYFQDVPPGASKGDLSDMMSIAEAARKFDHRVKRVL